MYENNVDKLHHVALVKGTVDTEEPILVRVHAACLAGDVFGSTGCDCASLLKRAMRMVQEAENGVILYMQQENGGCRNAQQRQEACLPRSEVLFRGSQTTARIEARFAGLRNRRTDAYRPGVRKIG